MKRQQSVGLSRGAHQALGAHFAGQYWQVADGPSSSLTINTDDIPLGSYTMDIVIYHYRSKEKFIPLGYASTQFSITGEFFERQKKTPFVSLFLFQIVLNYEAPINYMNLLKYVRKCIREG